ncbi:MAG: stage III sporulation protein AB [Oscillospiraceae bacterium]|nr:stage III sporulation protein AB [Oscillospiraceae bacterium]
MVKLLGSLCILAGGAMVRWVQASERRRRRDTLSGLLAALRRMAEEIRMARTPLPDLLERLSRDCGAETAAFFHAAASAARQDGELSGAWATAAEALPLADGDRAALRDLGKDLRGDEEKVCKAISLVIYSLAKSAEEQDRNRAQEERRATALCFSAAALLVILLI